MRCRKTDIRISRGDRAALARSILAWYGLSQGKSNFHLKNPMNEAAPKDRRINAIKRLKEASMVPDALREKCEKGEHIWDVAKFNPQRFQGGTSSTEYVCVVCGKREVEMDYGD